MTHFWTFLEEDLMSALYWEEWYNEGKNWRNSPCPGDEPQAGGPCKIPEDERMVMYANKLLGVPRLRQVRLDLNVIEIKPTTSTVAITNRR